MVCTGCQFEGADSSEERKPAEAVGLVSKNGLQVSSFTYRLSGFAARGRSLSIHSQPRLASIEATVWKLPEAGLELGIVEMKWIFAAEEHRTF